MLAFESFASGAFRFYNFLPVGAWGYRSVQRYKYDHIRCQNGFSFMSKIDSSMYNEIGGKSRINRLMNSDPVRMKTLEQFRVPPGARAQTSGIPAYSSYPRARFKFYVIISAFFVISKENRYDILVNIA